MRRRLTVATVAVTVGGVLVTGFVALLLSVQSARAATAAELRHEARSLALTIEAEAPGARLARLSRLLNTMRRPLRLEGAAIVADRSGATHHLPGGVPPTVLRPDALPLGGMSGRQGATVWAAAPFHRSVIAGSRMVAISGVVVLTRQAPAGWTSALPWLAVSSVGVAAVAAALTDRLGRRMLRPLAAVEDVTRRMAAGDLTARVRLPVGADPEVAALAGAIDGLGAQLEGVRAAQRRFLLSVSHDLRTPLTSLRGYAEALEDGTAQDPRAVGYVLVDQARRLARLVDDLMELGRLESGAFDLRPVPVALGPLVVASAAAFAPMADELGVTLDTDTARAAPAVLADPDRVAQMVANLLDNALTFARSRVVAGVDGPLLWIADDGPGISQDRLAEVWAPGYSARPSGSHGTGLGLAIVAELAGAMGARVLAESPLGSDGGTRMSVSWPLP